MASSVTLTHEFTGTMLGDRQGQNCRVVQPGAMRVQIAFADGKRNIVPRNCLRRLKNPVTIPDSSEAAHSESRHGKTAAAAPGSASGASIRSQSAADDSNSGAQRRAAEGNTQ